MLKILNTAQIRELDACTIREGIPAIDLMERACLAFVKWFSERFQTSQRIGIFCGTGNNGGDGLGIARLLNDRGYSVKVWIVRGPVKESGDFSTNLRRLQGKVTVNDFVHQLTDYSGCEILIDAIFGTGLNRPPEGPYADAIALINSLHGIRVAVDMPSGLLADVHSSGAVIKAEHTVSFQLPKLAFMFPENHGFVGEWHLADIDLSRSFLGEARTRHYYLTKESVKKLLRQRSTFDHKGTYGKALLVTGSLGKMGASVLAARAALRSGLGLLTCHVPSSGNVILQTAVPEAMTSVDASDDIFTSRLVLDTFDAVGIGPGMGQAEKTAEAFAHVLKSQRPLVIDADGLNLLGADHSLLKSVPRGSILTPHPKEFERMVGKWKDDFARLEKQSELSKELQSVVVLKGAHSSITAPDGEVYFNSTGNPGMATGGSGDVLTGMLTSLMAQHYSPVEAAMLGVYLHGLSGDIAAREKGQSSLIASDLIDFLPAAFLSLSR